MSNSFATTANLTCPACRQPFNTDLWLIVDTDERPDLTEQIRSGTLHDLTCPYCQQNGQHADAPLLLYRPTQQPHLIFSPAQQTSNEQDQAHAHQLIGLLRNNLDGQWQDAWLQQLEATPRALLSALLSDDPQAFQQLEEATRQPMRERLPPLLATLEQFIRAESWNESKQIVEQHPELLDETTDALLAHLAARQEEEGVRRMMEEHRTLLRRCREIGIDQAFAEKMRGNGTGAWPAALQAILQELSQPGRIADMPRRIQLCEAALTQINPAENPQLWAALQHELGISLQKNPQGPRAENLERAINAYEQALLVTTRQAMPVGWAITTTCLAATYANRIRGDRAENLERAIELNEQASLVTTRRDMPVEWAITTMNLANTYKDRIRGERAENLERAIDLYTQVLQVRTRRAMPVEWADVTVNLASAYTNRIHGERAENLERAIELNEQVLQVNTRQASPAEWAQVTMNLATGYAYRIQGERAENLERAIDLYKQALQVWTRQAMPVDWAEVTTNLASAYLFRIHGERAENQERAIDLYAQALAVYTPELFLADHQRVQNNLGRLHFQQGRWSAAASAFEAVLQAGEKLYLAAATPEARQGELGKLQGVPVQQAYALLRTATLDAAVCQAAVLVLERNRARWLSESLALRTAKPAGVPNALWQRFVDLGQQIQALQSESRLPEATPAKRSYLVLTELLRTAYAQLDETIAQIHTSVPDFMPQPNFVDIQATAQATPVVYLLTTSAGGLALIVQAEKVTPVWLAVTDAQVREWLFGPAADPQLGGWLGAYQAWLQQRTDVARQYWFAVVEQTTHQLWAQIMGPLTAVLADLTTPPGRSGQAPLVTLIPTGLLALLPLHTAWTPQEPHPNPPLGREGTVTAARRYFLDEFVVRYAPSARALTHAATTAQQVTGAQLLAVDEPRPVRGNALPNSAAEVDAISDHFVQRQLFAHEQATRTAVLAALPQAQVAHFSCHGGTDWENVLASGLFMANDEPLTVRDLLELQLPGARLATLSACETGIVGADLPDEVVALSSALVQAGFAGVVASLWSVADISTAMLMARFYDFWQGDKLEPAQALRAAQRWVRDTTNREKADYFGEKLREASGATRMPEMVAADFLSTMMVHKDGQDARSFEHPFWWAAFYLTGV